MAVDMSVRDDSRLSEAPSARPQHIDTLVKGVDRYNPSNCHLLEDYLKDQMQNDTYDPFANLALLKLYQFNPTLLSTQASLSTLFLSLINAPFDPDFSLAYSLLSESFVVGAPFPPLRRDEDEDDDDDDDDEEGQSGELQQDAGERATAEYLKRLSELLGQRQFKAFWSAATSPQHDDQGVTSLLDQIKRDCPNWQHRTRTSIANELELSFASLPVSSLATFFNLEWSDSEIQQLAKERGWQAKDGQSSVQLHQQRLSNVVAPPTDAKTTQQRLGIDQMSVLMAGTK